MNWTYDQPKRPGFYWAKQGNYKQIVEVTHNFNVLVVGHNITLTFIDFDMWSDSQIEEIGE